jgi:hypothetical protein
MTLNLVEVLTERKTSCGVLGGAKVDKVHAQPECIGAYRFIATLCRFLDPIPYYPRAPSKSTFFIQIKLNGSIKSRGIRTKRSISYLPGILELLVLRLSKRQLLSSTNLKNSASSSYNKQSLKASNLIHDA